MSYDAREWVWDHSHSKGTARMVLGDPKPMAETQREAAKATAKDLKTRLLHEGRPDVERTVSVPPKNL